VDWKTSNKNSGFVIFFGTDSPFDPDDPIIGGANKQVTVKAKRSWLLQIRCRRVLFRCDLGNERRQQAGTGYSSVVGVIHKQKSRRQTSALF
jgi:hypothetical protein